MGRHHKHLSLTLAMAAALVATTLSTGTAMAASGEITRAESSADWTQGSIAGTASWGGCNVPIGWWSSTICNWRPYVTVGTGTDPAECSSAARRWGSLGDGITLAWLGKQSSGGSAEFDLTEVPLSGEPGQLACLSLWEYMWEPYPCPKGTICIQVVGNSMARFSALDAALLEPPEEEAKADEESEEPPVEEPEDGEPEPEESAPDQIVDQGRGVIDGPDLARDAPGPEPGQVSRGEPPTRPKSSTGRCAKGKRLVRTRSGKRICRHRHRRHGRVWTI